LEKFTDDWDPLVSCSVARHRALIGWPGRRRAHASIRPFRQSFEADPSRQRLSERAASLSGRTSTGKVAAPPLSPHRHATVSSPHRHSSLVATALTLSIPRVGLCRQLPSSVAYLPCRRASSAFLAHVAGECPAVPRRLLTAPAPPPRDATPPRRHARASALAMRSGHLARWVVSLPCARAAALE
jgi:hypothetical protein